ncbi:MAG: carboxypeptidase regulatory-like domain-containing protein [Planctomycetes bacterium]|nr:carboxypeptidase regulatory-like domain-containing protein [Planctomycetota bacterium]
MHRTWLLLIVLAALLAAALLSLWRFGAGREVPMAQPSPVAPAAGATPAGPAVAETPAGRAGVDPADTPDVGPAVLEVRVVMGPTQAGIPVADAEVTLVVGGEPALDPALLTAPTDALGCARFRLAGGTVRPIEAHCLGALPAAGTLSPGSVQRLELRLEPRLQVRGQAVDAQGQGIAEAEIVLLPWTDRASHPPRLRRVGRTDADGRFELTLPAGGRLGAQHPAHAPSALFPLVAPSDPTAPPATAVVQLTLLGSAAGLDGRVRDAGGSPVAGAELEFHALAPAPAGAALPAPPQRVRSAADGSFAVDHLRPGRIQFRARARGHGPQRGEFELLPGHRPAIEVVLPAACAVHGRIEDADGAPLADCRVWSGAMDDLDGAFTVSAADGTFELSGLPPGPVRLVAREGPGVLAEPAARRAETTLVLAAGPPAHWLARLQAPSLEGLLRGQLVDHDGIGLADWRLRIRNREGVNAQGRTDAQGRFQVAWSGAGPVDVLAYAPRAANHAFADALQPGIDPEVDFVRIVVDHRQAKGRLVGRVVGAEQQPLAARVTLWHHQRQELARFHASPSGDVRIDQVPPGTLDVRIEHPGQAGLSRPGLTVDTAVPCDLGLVVLDRAAALYGEVVGPDGLPPAELSLVLELPTQRLAADYAGGVYRFAAAPPGRHLLRVQGPKVAAARFEVDLQAGVERRQDMQLLAGVPRRFVVRAPFAAGPTCRLAIREPEAPIGWFELAAFRRGADGTDSAEFLAFLAPGAYEAIAWGEGGHEARAPVQFVAGDDSPVRLDLRPR